MTIDYALKMDGMRAAKEYGQDILIARWSVVVWVINDPLIISYIIIN